MQLCSAPGCGKPPVGRHSIYCAMHETRLRRHGDIEQAPIYGRDLAPYRKLVRDWIARQPNRAAIGPALHRAGADLVSRTRANLMAAEAGRGTRASTKRAWTELLRAATPDTVDELVEVVAAAVIMQVREPHRFKSQQAFNVQLARRVMALVPREHTARVHNVGGEGMVRKVYRAMPQRAADKLGAILREDLGEIGERIHELEWQERERPAKVRAEALSVLGGEQSAAQ